MMIELSVVGVIEEMVGLVFRSGLDVETCGQIK